MLFDVYREVDTLELVRVIEADSYEEAVEKARALGYSKSYRVEEAED